MQPEHQHCVVDAHSTLRAGTRGAHHALHTLSTLDALAQGCLSSVGYARLLGRMHAFYRELDARLLVSCDTLLGADSPYRYCPRAPLLAADVAALADLLPVTDEVAADLTLPLINDVVALAGVIYVVEGSMLGAATLDRGARRVLAQGDRTHDDADECGRSYWAWARREAAARWAHTLELLRELLPTAASCARAVASADATFTALHAWLAPLDRASC